MNNPNCNLIDLEIDRDAVLQTRFQQDGNIPAVHQAVPVKPSREGGEVILLVDDEKSITNMAKLLLRSHDLPCLVANTPEEALRIFYAEPGLQLVICDIQMPGCDGFELMRKFRAHKPAVKILFSSGGVRKLPPDFQLSEVGFIQKPWQIKDLLLQVRISLFSSTPAQKQ